MDYYTKAEVDDLLAKTVTKAVEEALKSLPFVIHNLMATTAKMKESRDKFYKDNKDLEGRKDLVGQVMERVESENAGFSLDEVLKETSNRTRELIKSGGSLKPNAIERPSNEKIHDGLAKIMEEM